MKPSLLLAGLLFATPPLASATTYAQTSNAATQTCANTKPCEATDEFVGVWQESAFTWWSIGRDGVDILGTVDVSVNGARTPQAKLLFEAANSASYRKGLYSTSEGKNLKLELKASADGSALMGYIYLDNATLPLSLHRAPALGASADYRSTDELLERMQTVWTTPFGLLTITKATERP